MKSVQRFYKNPVWHIQGEQEGQHGSLEEKYRASNWWKGTQNYRRASLEALTGKFEYMSHIFDCCVEKTEQKGKEKIM